VDVKTAQDAICATAGNNFNIIHHTTEQQSVKNKTVERVPAPVITHKNKKE